MLAIGTRINISVGIVVFLEVNSGCRVKAHARIFFSGLTGNDLVTLSSKPYDFGQLAPSGTNSFIGPTNETSIT